MTFYFLIHDVTGHTERKRIEAKDIAEAWKKLRTNQAFPSTVRIDLVQAGTTTLNPA